MAILASTATFLPVMFSMSYSLMASGHSSDKSFINPWIPIVEK